MSPSTKPKPQFYAIALTCTHISFKNKKNRFEVNCQHRLPRGALHLCLVLYRNVVPKNVKSDDVGG